MTSPTPKTLSSEPSDSTILSLVDLPPDQAETMALKTREQGIGVLVGALIVRYDNRLFAQRRSKTRRLYPGVWDNVGGHLEGDETLYQALARETLEETGWILEKITRVIAVRDFKDGETLKREFLVLARCTGDMDAPVLEPEKVDQAQWLEPADLDLLTENRGDDFSQRDIYAHAFAVLHGC